MAAVRAKRCQSFHVFLGFLSILLIRSIESFSALIASLSARSMRILRLRPVRGMQADFFADDLTSLTHDLAADALFRNLLHLSQRHLFLLVLGLLRRMVKIWYFW